MKITKENKSLYMDILINGCMISSIAGIEYIELEDKMLIYTTSKHGNLNFIHHVKEVKEYINTNEYISYNIILDMDTLRD